MKRISVPLSTAVTAAGFLGCVAFVTLLPWGDPCSFVTPPGECCCPIVQSALQENIRNAAFAGICLLIGFSAGLITRSGRLIAGALSPVVAVFLAYYAVHWIYHIGWRKYPVPWNGYLILIAAGELAAMAAIGVIGAALSRYVRLTTASSAA